MALAREPQTLLVFRGPVAVGKSTLSRALGERLGWPVADKDDFSDMLLNLEGYGPLAYKSMFSVAESLLRQGFSVICNSPLRGEALAKCASAEFCLVSCVLSDKTLWKTRIETRERRPAHVIKTWADLDRYGEQASADFDYSIKAPALTMDMAAPLETNLERTLTWLQTEAT